MAEDDDAEPAIELGTAEPVAGAPLARVTSRLTWGIEHSEVERKEGDTTIRTPAGPEPLSDLLEDVETTYFATRQEFEQDLEAVIGDGPVETRS